VVREWRVVLDEYPDKVMVAEAWIPSWERLAKYVRPDEYHQTFDFEFLRAPWEAESVRAAISASITATKSVGSIPTWVLSNHDVIRHVTRYGLRKGVDMREWLLKGGEGDFDPMLGVHRARAAALLMLALPGSVYLYQGEELGLPEVNDLPEAVIEDPVWERSGHTEKGRDGCRVPLPWTPDGPSFGFGANGSWLPQPEIWAEMSAAGQEGLPGSTLELYREAISLRRDHLLGDEQLEWLDLGEDVIAFRRGGGVACVVNYGANPVRLPDGEVILASDEIELGRLPGNVAVWLRPS
jgi:alpha-glucosidase